MQTINLDNFQVLDKEGYVDASYIQSHLPSTDMYVIQLSNGYKLLAQDNHPVTIRRNSEDITIEVKDLDKKTDLFWFDNSYLFDIKEEERIDLGEEGEQIPLQILSIAYDENVDKVDFKYLKGNKHNFRLHPKFPYFNLPCLREIYYAGCTTRHNSFNFESQLWMIDSIVRDDKMDGYYPIENISKTEWNHPVFDIKTSSHHFLLNGIRTHNSFHTGGAVELKLVDIIDEIMTNVDNDYLEKVQKLIKQVNNDLFSIGDFTMIRLSKGLYNIKKYQEENGKYILPVGYFELSFRDLKINVHIEQETILYKSDEVEEDNETITMMYGKNKKLISVYPTMKDYPKMANILEGIFSGNSPWTTPESLYMKVMKIFGFEEPWDSVHMEVMLSNILRNKRDPHQLARLKEPYDPTLITFKQVPGMISWPLALAFENFSGAVQTGMISDRAAPSPIEKIMIGDGLLEDKFKK